MTGALELLLLDFDGVLAQYSRPKRFSRLAQIAGCSPTQVEEVLFGSGLEVAYDSGKIDTAGYLRQLGEGLGAYVGETDWVDARVAACEVDPRLLEMVTYAAERVPIAVLTNNGPLMKQAITQIVPSLFPALVGRVLCSAEFGGRKPQTQVYAAALARLEARAATTLFVDDLFFNVRGARAAGLHADTVAGAPSLRRVLKRYALA